MVSLEPPYRTACPHCNDDDGLRREHDRALFVCTECDAVIESDRLLRKLPFPSEDAESDRRRGGPPTTPRRHDGGLTTDISYSDRDARGKELSESQARRAGRMRMWHGRLMAGSGREGNRRTGLGKIVMICEALELSDDVLDRACYIFHRAVDEDLLLGRSIESVAAAVVVIASRIWKKPYRTSEVAAKTTVSEGTLFRVCRSISESMEMDIEPQNPKAFIPRVCADIQKGLAPGTREGARELLDKGQEAGVTGDPMGLAAAAIYVADESVGTGKLTQSELAAMADVTEMTILNRANDFREHRDALA